MVIREESSPDVYWAFIWQIRESECKDKEKENEEYE